MVQNTNTRECTIGQLFAAAVERFGGKTAVAYREDTYSWHDLDVLSDRMADRLEALGVAKGDRVGLWGENSAAWIVTFLALQKLGAVSALLNFNYRQRELEQVMGLSGIRWLCYGDTPALAEKPGMLEAAGNRLGKHFRGLMDVREKSLDLQSMLKGAADHVRRPRPDTIHTDTACMLYTTGTSMDPKCVQHSHYSLVNNAIFTAERIQMEPEDRICMSQPLFHIFGLVTSFLGAVCRGAQLCVLSHFGSETILRCVERHRCTILNGVPTNFICMITNPFFHDHKTDSLRLSIIGGANILPNQLDYIRQVFPNVHIMRNYGLTEGGNLCNSECTDDHAAVASTVGRPYPNMELAIWDPAQKRFLPPGEKGEIVARGYSLMQGYFCSPEGAPPPQAIDEDGWLHTGDVGVIDQEGRLSLVGRIKDIIIRGGENISPLEISREIQRYEPVLDVLVIGAPHPILGEEVVACLTLEEPEDYSEPELRSMLKTRLAGYKVPAFFLTYEQFPLMTSGKVDMPSLRRDVFAKVAELHKDDRRYHIMQQPPFPGGAHTAAPA